MLKMFTRFLAVAALISTASVASATQFPNATCPDSVTIKQIQDVTAVCHPAVGDTARGVGGTPTQLNELPTNTFAEQYEQCLVRIDGPLTVARTSLTGQLGTNSFLVVSSGAPSDSVFIDGNKLTTYGPPPVGTNILFAQGIL